MGKVRSNAPHTNYIGATLETNHSRETSEAMSIKTLFEDKKGMKRMDGGEWITEIVIPKYLRRRVLEDATTTGNATKIKYLVRANN